MVERVKKSRGRARGKGGEDYEMGRSEIDGHRAEQVMSGRGGGEMKLRETEREI